MNQSEAKEAPNVAPLVDSQSVNEAEEFALEDDMEAEAEWVIYNLILKDCFTPRRYFVFLDCGSGKR